MMQVPEACWPLLSEQRTHLTSREQYGAELLATYFSIAPYLPDVAGRPARILDIGCGMAGIDVFLYRHYTTPPLLILADKQGVAERIVCGFQPSKEAFTPYHDFGLARQLLELNDVPRIHTVTWDLNHKSLPEAPCDVVISLLSWGFHYPIADYAPVVSPRGVVIADCREGTDGKVQLERRGTCTVVHRDPKYQRVVCRVL